mmetsp:Transcript_36199/g.116244  ORF Transcript_36199/g.116244 Transcript_36199/m.116244 type:complete len:214 (-) Transcript_36199:325-966(-)
MLLVPRVHRRAGPADPGGGARAQPVLDRRLPGRPLPRGAARRAHSCRQALAGHASASRQRRLPRRVIQHLHPRPRSEGAIRRVPPEPRRRTRPAVPALPCPRTVAGFGGVLVGAVSRSGRVPSAGHARPVGAVQPGRGGAARARPVRGQPRAARRGRAARHPRHRPWGARGLRRRGLDSAGGPTLHEDRRRAGPPRAVHQPAALARRCLAELS